MNGKSNRSHCAGRVDATGVIFTRVEAPPTYGERRFGTNDGDRFGLVYVDFAMQQRTPKMSAQFFREVTARNAVM